MFITKCENQVFLLTQRVKMYVLTLNFILSKSQIQRRKHIPSLRTKLVGSS